MDHGGHDEGQGVGTQAQGVPLLDGEGAGGVVAGEELGEHLEGLGVAHQDHVRVLLRREADVPGVVGLQVLDDEVVRLPAP